MEMSWFEPVARPQLSPWLGGFAGEAGFEPAIGVLETPALDRTGLLPFAVWSCDLHKQKSRLPVSGGGSWLGQRPLAYPGTTSPAGEIPCCLRANETSAVAA